MFELSKILESCKEQKGNRWFIKRGSTTYYNRGFRSKREAFAWVSKLDTNWQAGFIFWITGDQIHTEIVNRKGVLASV